MSESRHFLVTGGAGFIGSNLVRTLLGAYPGCRVTNVDALTYAGNPENLADVEGSERYRFFRADITDEFALSSLVAEADVIVHLAAESHVDRSIERAAPFVRTNVVGTQTLLTLAHRAGVELFIHASTDEVYGPAEDGRRMTEEAPLRPSSPYAASKAAADGLVLAAIRTFSVPAIITRSSNNFGPYQFPEKVIPLFITNLMEGRKVPLYGDGQHVRDWLHVRDHCDALLAIIERGRVGATYNIASGNERTNLELTRALLAEFGLDESRIAGVADRPGHDRRYSMDCSRLRRETEWEPTRSAWPEALRETIEWYRANRSWWERVRSGAYRAYYRRRYGEEL